MKPYEDLPECPSNMCGARYTSLMFELHCEVRNRVSGSFTTVTHTLGA